MGVLGRDGNEWTLIWPDDEERNTVSVADGHGVPPERGWTMIPVVRADLHRGAVDALETIEAAFGNDDGRGQSHPAIREALAEWRSFNPRGQYDEASPAHPRKEHDA